jgi:hypothetical protein
VGRIWRREEIFKGRYADAAPDLLLEPAPLYSLTHAKATVERADWLAGDHRVDGVLAAAGPAVDRGSFPDAARLVDLAPTIRAAAGAPSRVAHAGTALTALVGRDRAAAGSARAEPSIPGLAGPGAGAGLDEGEAEEVEEHLRGLGYLE